MTRASLRPAPSPPCIQAQEVSLKSSGEVLLSGALSRGVVPSESVWDCQGGVGEVRAGSTVRRRLLAAGHVSWIRAARRLMLLSQAKAPVVPLVCPHARLLHPPAPRRTAA